ncbi:hypothetical protein [uncultured Winogradskyella sp.]|uniref:hypothetical protein n=1 Tax=uncultured Winogradskyella sp. TaxID=395353 RepID=UPI002625D85F|nr:hypothetical protein [uncultured Winogradskyella sp.]
MKKRTILSIGLLICLFSTSLSFGQEIKYACGVVNGSAMVYGEFNIFMYYTKIDEVNCYVSRDDAEQQLKEAFKSTTRNWDDAKFTVNFFDSYSEAENFKYEAIQNVRSRAASRRTISINIADQNVPFDFNCSN